MSLVPHSFTHTTSVEVGFTYSTTTAAGRTGRFIMPGSLRDDGPRPILNIYTLSNGVKLDAEGGGDGTNIPGKVSFTNVCYGMTHQDARVRQAAVTACLNKLGVFRAREMKASGDSPNYVQYLITARCTAATPKIRDLPVGASMKAVIDVSLAFEFLGVWQEEV